MALLTTNQSLSISMVHRRIDRSRGDLNMWLEEEGCRGTVGTVWLHDAPSHAMSRVEGKISHFRPKLKCRSQVAIGNIPRVLKEKNEMLRKAEDVAMARRSMNRVKRLKREINDLLSKEEKKLKIAVENAMVS